MSSKCFDFFDAHFSFKKANHSSKGVMANSFFLLVFFPHDAFDELMVNYNYYRCNSPIIKGKPKSEYDIIRKPYSNILQGIGVPIFLDKDPVIYDNTNPIGDRKKNK